MIISTIFFLLSIFAAVVICRFFKFKNIKEELLLDNKFNPLHTPTEVIYQYKERDEVTKKEMHNILHVVLSRAADRFRMEGHIEANERVINVWVNTMEYFNKDYCFNKENSIILMTMIAKLNELKPDIYALLLGGNLRFKYRNIIKFVYTKEIQ